MPVTIDSVIECTECNWITSIIYQKKTKLPNAHQLEFMWTHFSMFVLFFHSPYSTYIGKCVSVLFFSLIFFSFNFCFEKFILASHRLHKIESICLDCTLTISKERNMPKLGTRTRSVEWEWNKQCKNKGCLWIQAMIEQIELVPEQQLYWNWIGYAADI